jgi:hypothetical protein
VHLLNTIHTLQYAVPLVFQLSFAGVPYAACVRGTINGVAFWWAPYAVSQILDLTSDATDAKRFDESFRRIKLLQGTKNRRLYVGLSYLYKADRLMESGARPEEFAAEAILNYAKMLQVIFGTESRDEMTDRLVALGIDRAEVARTYIPAMRLRNDLDIGHPATALFTIEQSSILGQYARLAHTEFKKLAVQIVDAVESGSLRLPEGESYTPSAKRARMIDELGEGLRRTHKAASHGSIMYLSVDGSDG